MTDWDATQDGDGIKSLRKKFKEQAELLKQQGEIIARLNAQTRDVDVNQALADRGLDPRVAKFYPKDAAVDTASIDAWVEENKDIFGSRRVFDSDGNQNSDTLTETERRGYQAINDIAAYEASVSMDLKDRLDKIEYDPMNPQAAQDELFGVLKEFEGYINQ